MDWIFFLIAPLALLTALGVVIFKNPLYSALSLVSNLLLVACLYALLQAPFLAVVQVMVYAGAIVVLMVFMIMLLNEKTEIRGLWYWGAGLTAVALAAILLNVFLDDASDSFAANRFRPFAGTAKRIGEALFGKYALTFEVASLVILVGLVSVVMLGFFARNTKGEGK
jgi:NADH-quinone oxidoreductase subunit J